MEEWATPTDCWEKTRLHVFLATMALHSISEGAGVGVAYARSSGEAGVRRGALVATAIGAHNIPGGLRVGWLALVARGVGPGARRGGPRPHASTATPSAAPAFLFCNLYAPLHPLCLGFAAGCMISVVIGEMIPEALGDGIGQAAPPPARLSLRWPVRRVSDDARLGGARTGPCRTGPGRLRWWSVVAGGATAVGGLVAAACAPRKARRFDGAAWGSLRGVMLALAVLDIALP